MPLPVRRTRGDVARWEDPWRGITSLQQEMNRLFDDALLGWRLRPFGGTEGAAGAYYPRVDVSETGEAVNVTAELPGMEEKDVKVTVDDDLLAICGEKREEKKQEDEHTYTRETTYGSFRRIIPLPARIDPENASASLKGGVLHVTLPKMPGEEGPKGRKIEITTA